LEISAVVTSVDLECARALFREYARTLPVDLEDVGFSGELSALPAPYVPPGGILLIARDGDEVLGCTGVRSLDARKVAELKRLYVRPEARGRGVAEALVRAAISFAGGAGYEAMRLDSLPTMAAAQRLYERLGFREIPPYAPVTWPGMRFMELQLQAGAVRLARE
jgi:ribosomal protein S18 acetylase RimI-like enzyme